MVSQGSRSPCGPEFGTYVRIAFTSIQLLERYCLLLVRLCLPSSLARESGSSTTTKSTYVLDENEDGGESSTFIGTDEDGGGFNT